MTESAENIGDRPNDVRATFTIAKMASLSFTGLLRWVRDHARRAVNDALRDVPLARDTPLGQSSRSSVPRCVGDSHVIAGSATPPMNTAFANALEDTVADAMMTVTDDAGTQAEVTVTSPLGSKTQPLSWEASREKLRLGLDQHHDVAGQQLDIVESLLQTDESILTLHDALPQSKT